MNANKQLIVMRHAKSNWYSGADSDFQRPLNERGWHNARLVGEWLQTQCIEVDLLLHSSAVRTTQTAQRIRHYANWSTVNIVASEALYLCSLAQMLNTLEQIDPSLQRVVVVAHEPTCSALIQRLTGQWLDMVTASMAFLQFANDTLEDWTSLASIAGNKNHLQGFVTPSIISKQNQPLTDI